MGDQVGCMVLLPPSEAHSSREAVTHQSDTGQTKAADSHPARRFTERKLVFQTLPQPHWALIAPLSPVPPPWRLAALGLSDVGNSVVATVRGIILYVLVRPQVVVQNKLEA